MSNAPTVESQIRGPQLFGDAGGYRYIKMNIGDPLMLEREPTNNNDSNAIMVKNEEELPFGYIAREKSAILAPWIDRGWIYTAVVIKEAEWIRSPGVLRVAIGSLIVRCVPIKPISLLTTKRVREDA